MDSASLVESVAAAYTGCQTYRDRGMVEHRCTLDGQELEDLRWDRFAFETRFSRPNRLFFTFQDESVGPAREWIRHVVWSEDGSYRVHPSPHGSGVEVYPEFESLVGVLSFPSKQTICFVPPLLLLGAGLLVNFLRGESHVRTEHLKGVECLRIDAASAVREGTCLTVWVDAFSRVIRRVQERTESTVDLRVAPPWLVDGAGGDRRGDTDPAHMVTTQTIRFEPRLDDPVSEEDLRFEPPTREPID